jgi:mitogen-activated protein kinase kinase kinase
VSKFNKAENRKSIRSIAQGALKHTGIARYMGDKVFGKSGDKAVDKKSSHMWGNGAKTAEPAPSASPSSSSKAVPQIEEAPAEEDTAEVADPSDTLSVPGHGADVEAASFSWVKGQMIGRGSYGKVYIALNVLSGKMMAVKQVELMGNDGDVKQKEMVNALKGEIALLKDLSHPNIVQYLGTETSDTHLSM